jgi:DNA polymerase III subunit gamma/tau
MAWYNIYRPTTFEDVIGQELIKEILQKTVETKSVNHAYLLSGTRGVGKTTLARIFAQELNDTAHNPQASVDIIELDAASNTGIDDIRVLRESAQVPPIAGVYKIFIIDEVHMLSKAAMNALLKILEEPPTYLVFLLATTNPEKLLPTVLSRVIKLPLQNHTTEGLTKKLVQIAKSEKIKVEIPALELISKRANGSQRDAINSFETLHGYGVPLTKQSVTELLGLVPDDVITKLGDVFGDSEISTKKLLELSQELTILSIEPYQFLDQSLNFYLEASLTGGVSNSQLIRALSNVLELKYPITTHIQSLGLLLAWYNQNTTIVTSVSITEKKNPKIVEQVKIENNAVTEVQKKVIEPKQETSDNQVSLVNEDESEISAGLIELLKNLPKDPSKPNTLKMIPDLEFTANSSKSVLVSTAVGMFVPTLKSKPIIEWILETLKPYGIQEVRVEQKQSLVISKSQIEKKIIKPVIKEHSVLPPSSTQAKPAPITTPKRVTKEHKDGEIFYTVFGKLPEEGDVTNLVVLSEKIPFPHSTIYGQKDKSFDDHVDELFELE